MSENNPQKKREAEAENPLENKIRLQSSTVSNPTNQLNQSKKESCEDSSSTPNLAPLIQIAVKELELRRNEISEEIKELSKRKSNLEEELKTTFTGQSDAIARRVKGFQDYLTGALQDLAQSAEKLDLVVQPVVLKPSPLDKKDPETSKQESEQTTAIADTFKPDENIIRQCLEQFLGQPDFYADPWKLRRSLGPKDIQLLEDWFFSMGGRGAQPSRGSRSKNVLVSAALISILGELYGDRFQTLVLASQPERLGEWRRGLQDALGIEREDFGPNSGIVLFERANGVLERADRLEERGDVPLIIIDAAEQNVDIPILQFPIWLAFAAEPKELYEEEEFM